MTERQQTGLWFIITGILILSFNILSYATVNWALSSGFLVVNESNFTNDQQYVIGASAVFALKIASLIGVPLVISGILQVLFDLKKTKKRKK